MCIETHTDTHNVYYSTTTEHLRSFLASMKASRSLLLSICFMSMNVFVTFTAKEQNNGEKSDISIL